MSTAQAITAVGAGNANSVATIITQAPAQSPRRTPINPLDPLLTPIGDVAWGLMALLAAGYTITIACRARARRQAK